MDRSSLAEVVRNLAVKVENSAAEHNSLVGQLICARDILAETMKAEVMADRDPATI